MSNLITISGVTGYIDKNGTAQLNLENVSRGLGFTDSSTGVEYVRWARVDGYLQDFKFATCGERPEYIPENIFYRLAMKASNKTAEIFQAKVADEILPAIRKTGTYSTKPMTQIEMLAAQAQAMCELEKKTSLAAQSATIAIEASRRANTRISNALNVLAAPTDVDWQTATGDKIKRIATENQLSYVVLFGDLYKELEHTTHVNLKSRVSNLQARMKKAGATYKERFAVNKLHIISLDPKLKAAFDGIVRRVDAKYTATRLPQ